MDHHRLLRISKAELLRASAKDAKIFLGAAKISNEINVSIKLCWFARNGFYKTDPLDHVNYVSHFNYLTYCTNILAGHVHEGFMFIDSSNVQRLLKEKVFQTQSELLKNICLIKNYFKGKNLITDIRNRVSFHNDLGFLYNEIERSEKNFQFEYLEGEVLGHHVYGGIDDLITQFLTRHKKSDELPRDDLYINAVD